MSQVKCVLKNMTEYEYEQIQEISTTKIKGTCSKYMGNISLF